MNEPHDPFAERAVAGSVLASASVPAELRAAVRPDDFYDPALRAVVEVCWDHAGSDPVSVRTELLRRGVRGDAVDGVWLTNLLHDALPGASAYHGRIVRDMAVRRQVVAEATRAIQQASSPAFDPYEVAASVHIQTGALAERADPAAPSSAVDVHDFVKGPMEYDWLVPGLLERGDRLLLTGVEGGGKSVLVRQIAVCVAAGVHPFTGERFDPHRVLFIDLENGERTLRRHMIALRKHCDSIGRPIPLRSLMVEAIPSGVDLTRPDGEVWLSRLCEDNQPEMLIIGPLYRMHATDMAKEEPARHLTRVVDTMRARYSCCVVMESHAPHAGINGRSLRPVGSSLFMRWPEFGYGIRKEKEGGYSFVTWRGPRDERSWPTKLRRGGEGEWPWMDASHDSTAVQRYWNSLEDGTA